MSSYHNQIAGVTIGIIAILFVFLVLMLAENYAGKIREKYPNINNVPRVGF